MEAMHEQITKVLRNQLYIKLGQFLQENVDSLQRIIKNWKTARVDEIHPEVWKTSEFDGILPRHCNAGYD